MAVLSSKTRSANSTAGHGRESKGNTAALRSAWASIRALWFIVTVQPSGSVDFVDGEGVERGPGVETGDTEGTDFRESEGCGKAGKLPRTGGGGREVLESEGCRKSVVTLAEGWVCTVGGEGCALAVVWVCAVEVEVP